MDKPPRRFDPVALAVLSIGLAMVVAIGGYLLFSLQSSPPAAAPESHRLADAVAEVKAWLQGPRPPTVAPSAQPSAKASPAETSPARATPTHCSSIAFPQPVPAPRAVAWQLGDDGRWWRYRIEVDKPSSWTGATLTYRMFDSVSAPIVQAEFEHREGSATFRVGTFAAGHASHADMRFPGFFMLPVYLDRPLENGARFIWQTPWPLATTLALREADEALRVGWLWNLPQLREEPGRIKRYEATVRQWEEVDTPLGKIAAACIEATVAYVENGRTQATARETFWYAPRFSAVLKAIRDGETPDESASRITAELLEIEPRVFELVDTRPPMDKMDVDLGDGSVVAGDGQFSPDRLSILRQHVAAVAGVRLAGKRIEVRRLVTWYVRTPDGRLIERGGGLSPMPAEQYFDLPQLRKFPYWVICVVDFSVDGRSMHGLGVVGFAGEPPNFASHHRQALIGAVNKAITAL